MLTATIAAGRPCCGGQPWPVCRDGEYLAWATTPPKKILDLSLAVGGSSCRVTTEEANRRRDTGENTLSSFFSFTKRMDR